MPTRSTVLARANVPNGTPTILFTVPAGHTYIVKGALADNHGAQQTSLELRAYDPGGVIFGEIFNVFASGGGSYQTGQIWVALNPGDYLVGISSGADAYFWISGANLLGTAS